MADVTGTVDSQIVLAVDASSSVNFKEFSLQMNGLAAAFRDPAVIAAATAGPSKSVAVTLIMWASPGSATPAVHWTKVAGSADGERLATAIDGTPRLVQGGGTGIAAMLSYAASLFEDSPYRSARWIVDVAGDGSDTHDLNTGRTRDRLVAQGIVVNGLPILNEEPDLDDFYRNQVIGGAGAFTLPAANYKDFATAIRAKLIREMGGDPVVAGLGGDRRRF